MAQYTDTNLIFNLKTKGLLMKTAVYMRVSTDDQSISMQKQEISTFLENRGITDAQIYSDEGISGVTDDRPHLKALKNDLKLGKIELLVIWKLDRLFRSLTQLLAFLNELKERNVKLISIKDNIDLTTPSGVLMMQLIGAFAEFERNIIMERTRAGQKAAKARGVKFGRPTKIGTALEHKILELRNQGLTFKKISNALGVSEASACYVVKKLSRVSTLSN